MEPVQWGVLVGARLLPGLAFLPAFGGRRLPVPVLLGLCACISALLVDLAAGSRPPPSGLAFAGLLLKELAVGTVLAVCAVAAFEAMRMAGQWIDDLRGDSRTQSSLPHSDGSASSLASLHLLLACLVFFELGGPGRLLAAVRDSLVCLPVDHWPDGGLVERAGLLALEATATAVQAGIQIAWPIAVCVLSIDLLLGFINRAAPQMQVFFLGMPARAILGLAVAALGLERAATWFGLALPG